MAPSTFLPLLVLALAVGLGAAQNATMVFTGDSTLCKLGDMLNNGMPCSGKAWKCEWCVLTCPEMGLMGTRAVVVPSAPPFLLVTFRTAPSGTARSGTSRSAMT